MNSLWDTEVRFTRTDIVCNSKLFKFTLHEVIRYFVGKDTRLVVITILAIDYESKWVDPGVIFQLSKGY